MPMRRILGLCLASWLCASVTAMAAGGNDVQSGTAVNPGASTPRVYPKAVAVPNEDGAYSPQPLATDSTCEAPHSCRRTCEAGRYRSNLPHEHCRAIAKGLREIGDVAVDVPYSFHEWARKIK